MRAISTASERTISGRMSVRPHAGEGWMPFHFASRGVTTLAGLADTAFTCYYEHDQSTSRHSGTPEKRTRRPGRDTSSGALHREEQVPQQPSRASDVTQKVTFAWNF